MNFKILNTIGEAYTEEARPILEKLGSVDYFTLTQKELEEKIGEYDALVVGLGLNIHRPALEQAEKLKIIATATTGLDHIDVEYAKSKRIEILSLRGENDFLDTITGTAELAFGLALDLMRFSPFALTDVLLGKWDRDNFRGRVMFGKTLGVVGIGRLGKLMARYGDAFGMRVLFTDPHVSQEKFPQYTKVDLETLLRESDCVAIHVHLSPETENMFDSSVFKKMKNSAYLVNTSRGKIVNEDDLIQALKDGEIAGYASDVLSGELEFGKDCSKDPLIQYAKKNRNVIIVPHIGGMTVESRERTDIFIAEKLVKYFKK